LAMRESQTLTGYPAVAGSPHLASPDLKRCRAW
jgi:hypothetical protein